MPENGQNSRKSGFDGLIWWKQWEIMSGTSFGTFWDFLTIFEQFSFFHWKSMIFRKNSKNPYFDLWDLLWWVFHMVLALNHWFRPKNEGSKKSVPQNCKSAGSVALKKLSFSLHIPITNKLFEDLKSEAKTVPLKHIFLTWILIILNQL